MLASALSAPWNSVAHAPTRTAPAADEFSIEKLRFNNGRYVVKRVLAVRAPATVREALHATLGYLYFDEGPAYLPQEWLLTALQHLDAAERVVVRWFYTRSDGRICPRYGSEGVRIARMSRYRCDTCGYADVRVLGLERVKGRPKEIPFACLCPDCFARNARAAEVGAH